MVYGMRVYREDLFIARRDLRARKRMEVNNPPILAPSPSTKVRPRNQCISCGKQGGTKVPGLPCRLLHLCFDLNMRVHLTENCTRLYMNKLFFSFLRNIDDEFGELFIWKKNVYSIECMQHLLVNKWFLFFIFNMFVYTNPKTKPFQIHYLQLICLGKTQNFEKMVSFDSYLNAKCIW